MHWQYLSQVVPSSFPELSTVLLANRGVTDSTSFYNPPHPLSVQYAAVGIDELQLRRALDRIAKGREGKETVVIFGDYDADGITATAVVWRALKEYGIAAQPFIPLRDKHGYGLSIEALKEVITQHNPTLLITVDNGIVAHEAVEYAQQQGIDVVLTDHHQPEDTLPPAFAIVHTTQLCGASVAWMLIRGLISTESASQLLDLVGIATIADQVPLLAANRSFAFFGIEQLRKTTRKGITSLLTLAAADQSQLDSTTVGFVLAPRINAMGRLAQGMDALRLLCSESDSQVTRLTTLLGSTNSERQELTRDLYEVALAQAEVQKNEHIIVVSSTEFHEGVIGLLAGRLVEAFAKPAIVLAVGQTTAKASVRSVAGVPITDFLRQFRADMTSLGGHPLAAGFGVLVSQLPLLQKRIQDEAKKSIDSSLLTPTLSIECKLPADLVTLDICAVLEACAPFGSGNEHPIFAFEAAQLLSARAVGKDASHILLQLTVGLEKAPISVIGWRQAWRLPELIIGSPYALAGTIEKNVWKNKTSLQLVMKDIRPQE